MKFVNKNDFDANQFSLESADFLKQRKVTPPPIILDIRTQEAFTADHLVGAHSLPADSLEDNLMQLPPFGQVLLYGGSDLEKTE
ncbi:MAG: rhodanese-related sulfurtransferase, partial [bacterium]